MTTINKAEYAEYLDWPSDHQRNRINVVDFYHKVLWASQQYTELLPAKNNQRVSFSADPPIVYEYEPEYSKCQILNYRTIFQKAKLYKQEFHFYEKHQQLNEPFLAIAEEDNHSEDAGSPENNADTYDKTILNARLQKTRSFTDIVSISRQLLGKSQSTYATKLCDPTDVPSEEMNSFHSSLSNEQMTECCSTVGISYSLNTNKNCINVDKKVEFESKDTLNENNEYSNFKNRIKLESLEINVKQDLLYRKELEKEKVFKTPLRQQVIRKIRSSASLFQRKTLSLPFFKRKVIL
ncbi:hypothetical protein G6F57_006560 [Rhizopus arrhizus]|nr:hypothetical protein G6F30_007536 [Rhizopus arrhizus]KAG1415875.1 hypothetical protein G6F58_006268 [Rhizopus delemar]KAG0980215.1 hypothetical protein G6F29_007990 [Rhizopus arrhizus]KAG0992840.1 hypothetical protein G6F28_007262 [Rhizopus arrhizus]KAG1006773.1 hypothetical protein G6F27_007991 [Rhizopus arrhizus]